MNRAAEKKIKMLGFLTLVFIYFEILYKILVTKHLFSGSTIYTILFSINVILIINLFCKLFKGKTSKIILLVFLILITIYYIGQIIFFRLYSVPFSFSTIGLAGRSFNF